MQATADEPFKSTLLGVQRIMSSPDRGLPTGFAMLGGVLGVVHGPEVGQRPLKQIMEVG